MTTRTPFSGVSFETSVLSGPTAPAPEDPRFAPRGTETHPDRRDYATREFDTRAGRMGGAMASLRRVFLDELTLEQIEDLTVRIYVNARALAGKTEWPAEEPIREAKITDRPLTNFREVALHGGTYVFESLLSAYTGKAHARTMGRRHDATLRLLTMIEDRALCQLRAVRALQGKTAWPTDPQPEPPFPTTE